MELYIRIGILMEQHGFTNQSMSDATGIPIGTISGIRSGKIQNPSFESVCAILEAMGESPESLYGDGAATSTPPEVSARKKMMEQASTVAAQAATLEAKNESIADYKERIAGLEAELQCERKRAARAQIIMTALIIAIIMLAAVYIWDVRNLHTGLTAYFNGL